MESGAARWQAQEQTFGEALSAAAAKRFQNATPDDGEVEAFVRSLHLQDLALACACRDGSEVAWERLVQEYRPRLVAAARSMGRGDADDLVEPLIADLYGLPTAQGVRASLLAHYHGRARLNTWLRSVLAQRYIDAYRATRRAVPLDEAPAAAVSADTKDPGDPFHSQHLELMQKALDAAIQGLAPGDRLRLRLYYGQSLKLARIGQMLGESEATVSRKLERARKALRDEVDRRLREEHCLSPDAIQACFAAAESAPEIDPSALLDER